MTPALWRGVCVVSFFSQGPFSRASLGSVMSIRPHAFFVFITVVTELKNFLGVENKCVVN